MSGTGWLEVEMLRRRERLLPARACLLVIDIQERLAAAMQPEVIAQVVRNTELLVAMAKQFVLPIVVSQQYPKGLGETVSSLASAIADAEAAGVPVYRFDKTVFSAAESPAFQALPPAEKTGPLMQREQWIVTGMETHVCVYQTVRDLVGPACAVHVVSDAVASRTKANWRAGIDLCRQSGAMITSTEAVVFDMLRAAGSDQFKVLSKLLK